ncbi:MAG: hypothetical protein ICV66_06620, partial [Chitinophagaceae bacterium]|nr:hypothetical protein [Chitinophagaceae bacterium]
AAPVFVNNKAVSLDYAGTVTTVGYQINSEKWLGNIYFMKPFYKDNSELVQSALKAQTSISLTNLNQVLNLTAAGDVKFSDKIDFGVTAGIDHILRTENKNNSVLVIDPSLYIYAGTQQFQQTYYKHHVNPLVPGSQAIKNVNEFNVLAYEVSVPIVYVKGKVMFIGTPAYIIPQNLIVISNRPDISERGKDMFYTTIGLKYTF